VEQDPLQIWSAQMESHGRCWIRGNCGERTAAIGITNQRGTTVVWESRYGQAISPAIVWSAADSRMVRRTASSHGAMITAKTGLWWTRIFPAARSAGFLKT